MTDATGMQDALLIQLFKRVVSKLQLVESDRQRDTTHRLRQVGVMEFGLNPVGDIWLDWSLQTEVGSVRGVAQWLGRRSLTGGLSMICAWSMVDVWPLRGQGVRYGSTNQANSASYPQPPTLSSISVAGNTKLLAAGSPSSECLYEEKADVVYLQVTLGDPHLRA